MDSAHQKDIIWDSSSNEKNTDQIFDSIDQFALEESI